MACQVPHRRNLYFIVRPSSSSSSLACPSTDYKLQVHTAADCPYATQSFIQRIYSCGAACKFINVNLWTIAIVLSSGSSSGSHHMNVNEWLFEAEFLYHRRVMMTAMIFKFNHLCNWRNRLNVKLQIDRGRRRKERSDLSNLVAINVKITILWSF